MICILPSCRGISQRAPAWGSDFLHTMLFDNPQSECIYLCEFQAKESKSNCDVESNMGSVFSPVKKSKHTTWSIEEKASEPVYALSLLL